MDLAGIGSYISDTASSAWGSVKNAASTVTDKVTKDLGGVLNITVFPLDIQKTGIDFIILTAYIQNKSGDALAKEVADNVQQKVKLAENTIKDPIAAAGTAATNLGNTVTKAAENAKDSIVKGTVVNDITAAVTGGVNAVDNAHTKVTGLMFADTTDAVREIVGSVILPIPEGLVDVTTHNWNQSETGFTKAKEEASAAVTDAVSGGNSIKSAMVDAAATGARQSTNYRIRKDFFQDYEHSEPRSFTFSWMLVPKSLIESALLLLTIKRLKEWTVPIARENDDKDIIIHQPHTFKMRFANPTLMYLFKTEADLACNNVEIDYNGQGYNDFHWDGTPKAVKLTLTFNETKVLTKNELPYAGVLASIEGLPKSISSWRDE